MSKFSIVVLALALSACVAGDVDAEDFAFDVADDLEVEFDGDKLVKWNERDLVAYVGRVFHLVVPIGGSEKDDNNFEVKRHSGKGLPSWLLFDKKGGVFWGVPLTQDVGVLRLTIKDSKSNEEELAIKVVEPTEEPGAIEECQQNEDNTVLTLLLDKNIKAIKPKQRIIAINNIAKFFGLSYSAFTLKPQLEKDDITDSSVVLAGPGNLQTRTSKVTSLLQVAVGCEGRLWLSTAAMVHQLKQQARDGTVSEVLRLPLIGWRVKTETKPIVRTKRRVNGAAEDDFGSGDYNDEDEYYDDYEDYESEDLGDVEKVPPNSIDVGILPTSKHFTKPSVSTPTTTPSMDSTTHLHRHHHGEMNPSIPIVHHQTTHKNLIVDEVSPVSLPPTLLEVPTTTKLLLLPGQSKATQPDEVLNYEDNYDYGQYDDDDDDLDESIESETIIPDTNKNPIKVDSVTEEPIVKPTTSTELITDATSKPTSTSSTSSTTESIVIYSSSSITSTESVTQTTPVHTTAIITETPVESIEDNWKDTTTEQIYAISREATTKEQTTETIYNLTNVPAFIYTDSTTVTQQHYDISTTPSTAATNATPIYEVPTTTPEELSTTEKEQFATQKATTIKEVTEIEYHKNFNPFIENRLQPIVVVAGKIFRSVIPRNTFKDFEDEYDLTYQLLDSNNNTISNNSWLQFNAARRELYGLPLANDTSKYVFWVKAFDKDGASEQEKLNIQVQQHKLEFVVNHEFSLLIRIEKHQEFNHYVDWSLKVLRALGKIYNTNMTEITVRKINYTSEPIIFTWSNDSIPTNYCPRTEIVGLFQTLTANDRGDPSRELNMALSPELRVKKVIYRELGVCEQPLTPVTPPTNFSPLLRNPIDNITATVGQLLIYRVKEDTFYDPEDVDPRMLNVSLLTGDRQNIPGDNWLQFDNKNREFYGIARKPGRSEYQLVCIDSGGKMVTDSLEVVVYPALKRAYNVEFSMNITDIPHEMFINSASLQRKFVEKLMFLFKEQTPAHFHFLPFKRSYDSTIVTWFNKSLSINRCPHEDIRRLESIVHNMNDRSISQKVHIAMEPEFKVSTIKVHLIGNCKPRVSQEPRPDVSTPIEESSPQPNHNEYLTNYILPALIVIIMLILAIIGALVLYRKKRIGKMNLEEDGRQSYGNKGKGIPVIFQEELEEKPEPGTKAPVILKDEKPPLAPPEYSKSGSVKLADDSEPYQPPPPFTRTQDNGRQSRPKPTPTYRKPPPYVPP